MRHRNKAVITGATLGLAVSLLLAGFARAIPPAPDTSGYHIVKKIVTGGTEGWDYITMDNDARLAYIGREDHVDVLIISLGLAGYDSLRLCSQIRAVERTRNQLLACTCFSQYQYGRICWTDQFGLFEHRFQRRAISDDLLESRVLTGPLSNCCQGCHITSQMSLEDAGPPAN